MSKNIVLLSDGTGNSSAKLFKTNVWRLYQALDLTDPRRQIAFYDDGVGTSSFRPLFIIGGVFGVGLKRNVLDLYNFLCRNYEPGDRIYMFGFSRGAYTVRVLTGLVLDQGLLTCRAEEDRELYAFDAYRAYRKRFNPTGGLVKPLRAWRDKVISWWRRRCGRKLYSKAMIQEVPDIAFLGVWDTVAAYGTPVAELTRAIDDWIWPLSMPSRELDKKVKQARHALALDEERDTFRPLVWDEMSETTDRLQQVWFAGAHSDVGGGYPDDSLSFVSLDWMMTEATSHGLILKRGAHVQVRRSMDANGIKHDSRSGLAAYYRYQPRKISSWLGNVDPTTRIMRDPEASQKAQIRTVWVHDSVPRRIETGSDQYAPIVLPETFTVVGTGSNTPILQHAYTSGPMRALRQEWVWNDVWKRRVTYFATVGVSLSLLVLPLWQHAVPPSICNGPQCLAAGLISAIGVFLPSFMSPWIDAFAKSPGFAIAACLAIIALMMTSTRLQRRIWDGMAELWGQSMGRLNIDNAVTPAGRSKGHPAAHWIWKLRARNSYQKTLRSLKWRVIPGVIGFSILALGGFLCISVFLVFASRMSFAVSNYKGGICADTPNATLADEARESIAVFQTSDLCWGSGVFLEKGRRYKILVTVDGEWKDGNGSESIGGARAKRVQWQLRDLGIPLRRSLTDPWFTPMARIGRKDGFEQPLDFQPTDLKGTFEAQLTAAQSGELFMFVNDAVLGRPLPPDWFYQCGPNKERQCNQGSAKVHVIPIS
jgi:uncharacterized protein (DUF2235 family)